MLPGVALLAEVLEAARAEPTLARCLGATPRLAIAKFLAPVRPGASLEIEFALGARTLEWRVRRRRPCGGQRPGRPRRLCRGRADMRAESGAAPPTAWARQRERSNLRAAAPDALDRGERRAARGAADAASDRLRVHPERARPRQHRRATSRARSAGRATWRDVYAHLFTFAATVLDRVYLLQERFDEFAFEASGVEAIMAPFNAGRGVLAFGAHFGSFEALRMIGHDRGLRVAMIMYEDNARFINETLAAMAPRAQLHTIALGRVDAMLALRRWLDEGGVAGMLADRTLPGGNAQRSKAVRAAVPRRAGALSRRAVPPRRDAAPEGRVHGRPLPRRPRYDLRFIEIADFALAAGASAPSGAERDAAIRAALERYVATLESLCREAPYNWFNFYDFWADADATEPAA